MSILKILLIVIAVLCGLALIFNFDTGSLKPLAVAGIGIICSALASAT